MDQAASAHAQKISKLQSMSREEILNRRFQSIIDSYKKGELTADDLRLYTNIDPEMIETD